MKRLLIALALLAVVAAPARGQGSTMPIPLAQWFDNSGLVLSAGGLCVFTAGTSSLATTYTTAGLSVSNANPVLFDSAGRPASQGVFLEPGNSYKFVLKDFTGVVSPTCIPDTGVTLWSVDNVAATPLATDIPGTAGETLPANSSVYLSKGDGGRTAGRWYLTDADLAYASSLAEEVGWVTTAIPSGTTGVISFTGIVTTAAPVVAGTKYYASATAGDITATAPTNQRVVGVSNSSSTLVLGIAQPWTMTAVPLTTAAQPTGANAGPGATIQRTDGVRGLWTSTGTQFYALNGGVADFGAFNGVGDNATDNDTAFDTALAALPSTGGVLYLPPGEFFTSDLITLTVDHTIIRGAGVGLTTIRSTDTTGAIQIKSRYSGLENLTVLYEGAASYGVKIADDNPTPIPGTGPDRQTFTNVKIKGANGTGNGLWLVNSIHGTYANLYVPCGDGNAIQLDSSAFNTFTDVHVTVNLGETCTSAQWVNGLVLQKQTGNTLQSDDNEFYNLIVEGVSANGVYLTSILGAGSVPARNSFFGGTSEGNGAIDVYLENGAANEFYGYHAESSPAQFVIDGQDGNVANKFVGCQGAIEIQDPSTTQGIQATTIVGHVGNVTIAGAKVFGTQIYGVTGTLTDSGTNTLSFASTIASSPNATTTYKFNTRTFSDGPKASANAVQGSGGAAVTIVALPATSYGTVHVFARQSGTTNVAYYRVDFVNGTGVAIAASTPAAAGSNAAQLTFSLSGSNLQAKGNNATAPDAVFLTIDSWPNQ